ncbi:toprim domain-containing protein [Algibacter sp. L4_22]|uniref:toprim domain-containing protein n=1 Tax=Algibacter sp. L4_22 TaxID=2942477 RepID=UPI00201B8E67|nr:toprim domain-containing protein [Algibacter sp. L4_22]MCL5127313.1 toprim domain-containing protein [Algibacter sp. L4_22]
MNCEQANRLSLHEILLAMGMTCTKYNNKESWFLSPFRTERTASLKTNRLQNVWYDHGSGEGGNVIDFIKKLKNYDTTEALNYLRSTNTSNIFSFQKQGILTQSQNSNIIIKKLCQIQNPALKGYLKSRKININEALIYCKEIHYTEDDQKPFFGIGFKNDFDGFEFRNKYFKSCLINKNITTILNGSKTLCIFEGFTDFLSYRTLRLIDLKEDYVILNSTSLASRSITLLQNYNVIKTYLDNDDSGKKATLIIKENCNNEFQDCSNLYENYKDLNEYLIALEK